MESGVILEEGIENLETEKREMMDGEMVHVKW